MKLIKVFMITLAIGQSLSVAVGGCKAGKTSSAWDKISVSSSGEAKLQNITDGASKISNVRKENILMQSHGKQLNQNRHVEKSRVIGGGITEIETNGNNEIDVGSPALLKKANQAHAPSHGHGHGFGGYGHGHGYGGYGHGYGGYGHGHGHFPAPHYGYGHAHGHAHGHVHGYGHGYGVVASGASASASSHAAGGHGVAHAAAAASASAGTVVRGPPVRVAHPHYIGAAKS